VNGRLVTAEDVKASFDRQIAGDASFVRRPLWTNIESLAAPEPGRVVVKVKAPLSTMVGRFADANAFIVPVEAARDPRLFSGGSQIGSGPFQWVDWADGKFASVSRNPRWHGGPQRPLLEGVSLSQPANAVEVEGQLRTKKLDVAVLGRPQADRIKRAIPALNESAGGHVSFYGMRFFIRQVPYTDARVRSAIAIAIDRRAMVDRFFQGSGELNGWVSWPLKRWALPPDELATIPGHRPGTGGREADIAEAKAMLAASGQAMPEEIPLFVPEDTENSLGLGGLIKEQLKQALGLNVSVYKLAIGDIVQRLLTGEAPWAAGPDNGWADLDDWLYPFFHSDGTKNSFALRDAELDALINAQRTEFDNARRRDLGLQAQRRILALNAGVNFISERIVTLSWPYVRDFPIDVGDGYQHRFAGTSIDTGDPTFRGR
jgi:ABC-type transport system substrate-binding protein